MSKLKPWRFALGWKGWREAVNSETGHVLSSVVRQQLDTHTLSVPLDLIEGGHTGAAGSYRDAARTITLVMTEREAIELAKRILLLAG